jgi:hypothetical protein
MPLTFFFVQKLYTDKQEIKGQEFAFGRDQNCRFVSA